MKPPGRALSTARFEAAGEAHIEDTDETLARHRGRWAGLAAGLALLAAGGVWWSVGRPAPDRTPPAAPAPMSVSPAAPVPEAFLADPATPCARPEECGRSAREVWPALPI